MGSTRAHITDRGALKELFGEKTVLRKPGGETLAAQAIAQHQAPEDAVLWANNVRGKVLGILILNGSGIAVGEVTRVNYRRLGRSGEYVVYGPKSRR